MISFKNPIGRELRKMTQLKQVKNNNCYHLSKMKKG